MEDEFASFNPFHIESMLLLVIEELALRRQKNSEEVTLEHLTAEKTMLLKDLQSESQRVLQTETDTESEKERALKTYQDQSQVSLQELRKWQSLCLRLERESDDVEEDCRHLVAENVALSRTVRELEGIVESWSHAQSERVSKIAQVQKAVQAVQMELAKLTHIQQEVHETTRSLKQKNEATEWKMYEEIAAQKELQENSATLSRHIVNLRARSVCQSLPSAASSCSDDIRNLHEKIAQCRSEYRRLLCRISTGDLRSVAVQAATYPSDSSSIYSQGING